MNVLGQLRKAVFGETWALPLGVALLLGVAALLKALSPDAWRQGGGAYLVVATVVLLVVLLRRGSRQPGVPWNR